MEFTAEKLQTSIRRLQLWNALLLCLVFVFSAAVIWDHFVKKRVVRAQSIQLVSTEGKVLAELAAKGGRPGLYLKDHSGVNRAALFHDDDGTGLYIMDAESVTRIGIAQFEHGGGGVALHGPKSKGAAVLYFKDEGSLRFFNSEGEVINQVTARKPKEQD